MAIELFPHNQTAYEAAVTMLAERRKAAVVHPTGTGKSFIGFKLCEDNPDKIICWLSPSRYIYQTQIENLKEVSDGYEPGNVKFYTYAKLMMLTDEEFAYIKPDYIILDEFHRCGAEYWGAGVQKLLELHSNTPLLGLSATAIRYLDNQRNMTDELFDGNIASEMTLGEAIVRGILNPPKYILSIFSYQKDLELYEKRVQKTRYKEMRDESTVYLEALRRALDNAENLDEIFDRHMEDRKGKYIVFCANREHMDDMIKRADEWFCKIDKKPHIYKAYSNDPETSKAFQKFKADKSAHLKLLYCIDMLNEGVHVEDVSGVILLRPTVSPIIYKQQIGRALCAGKLQKPVIFDIVNNIENLYSIDSIKEEMQAAIMYYRYTGENSVIVNDQFEILDEAADCKELFEKLEGTLSASWDIMYSKAEEYYNKNGDLIIPANYYTEEGYSLGRWLIQQRKCYAGKTGKPLTQVQIDKLEKIGIVWGSHFDYIWNKYYEEAEKYYKKHGNLRVPAGYVTENNLKLGIWILRMRQAQADRRDTVVTPEKKAKLDEIGMMWNVLSEQWEKNYLEAVHYYNENGNLYMDNKYITETGFKLGYWIVRLRQNKDALTEEQIKRLDSIGMVWDTEQFRFDEGFRHAQMFYEVYRHLKVAPKYISEDGYALGNWVLQKRRQYAKGSLNNEKTKKLESIGMLWNPFEEMWQEMFQEAEKYYRENGNIKVSRSYTASNGKKLEPWIAKQKAASQSGKLSEGKTEKLRSIGII